MIRRDPQDPELKKLWLDIEAAANDSFAQRFFSSADWDIVTKKQGLIVLQEDNDMGLLAVPVDAANSHYQLNLLVRPHKRGPDAIAFVRECCAYLFNNAGAKALFGVVRERDKQTVTLAHACKVGFKSHRAGSFYAVNCTKEDYIKATSGE